MHFYFLKKISFQIRLLLILLIFLPFSILSILYFVELKEYSHIEAYEKLNNVSVTFETKISPYTHSNKQFVEDMSRFLNTRDITQKMG
jgi:hypothetical protein